MQYSSTHTGERQRVTDLLLVWTMDNAVNAFPVKQHQLTAQQLSSTNNGEGAQPIAFFGALGRTVVLI